MRKVIHVDMDCFYAAVEERERPELRGLPVGVGGLRGVMTTCNYEARKYGVRSAMPTFMALQRCPQLVVVKPRFDLYRADSARVREIFARFTHLIEPLSLDEAYLDVSHHERPATEIAREIRAAIFAETGLTASAGIAPNKLLAKIASDFRKPNGQYTVKPTGIAAFMQELPLRKIHGIGEVTAKRIETELGVTTCGELQAFTREELADRFGKFGHELHDRCRGIDTREVQPNRERKSLSNESTFAGHLTTFDQCIERMDELHADMLEDLVKRPAPRPIAKLFVKMRFKDFTHTSVERCGIEPALDAYRELLAQAWQRRPARERIVRLIGVGVRFQVAEKEIREGDDETAAMTKEEGAQFVLALNQ